MKPTGSGGVSEFGSGLVVCLAKFSEHLMRHGPYDEQMVREYVDWLKTSESAKNAVRAEAELHPRGDSAQRLGRIDVLEILARHGDPAAAISRAIHLWMNGASDHFLDLDERAPEPLRELAALTLRIGHGFTGETWTIETVDRIRELWKESCLALDEMLGIESDWGEW